MIVRVFSVLLPAAMLSGCVGLAVAGAGASTIGQGKTPVDHAVSWFEGKDCSITRSRQGLTYCSEDEPEIAYQGHCYRTLGEVTCYTEAKPFPGRQTPLHGGPALAAKPPQGATVSSPLAAIPSNMN